MAQPTFARKERRSLGWLALPLIAAIALAGVLVVLNQRADGSDPFRLRLDEVGLGTTIGSFTRLWSRAAQGAEVPADGARATEFALRYEPAHGVDFLDVAVLARDGSRLWLLRPAGEESVQVKGQRRSSGGESLESFSVDAPGTPLDPALLALDWIGLERMEPYARRMDLEGAYSVEVQGPGGRSAIDWAETAYLWQQGEFERLAPEDDRRRLSGEVVVVSFVGPPDPDTDRQYTTHFLVPVPPLSPGG